MKVTLLQKPGKVSFDAFKSSVEAALSDLKGSLSAAVSVAGVTEGGWVQIDLQGKDCEILRELALRKYGQAWADISDVEAHGIYDGIISRVSQSGVEVDIGIERPELTKVLVTANALQAQLADGRPLSAKEIAQHYCLLPSSRLTVRITRLEQKLFEGWLADLQINLFSDWVSSRLDRVQVFHCLPQQLDSAIRKANLERDVIASEQITLTTHSVLCKLGTDGIGLIPKLGSILRKSELAPFLPRRILERCRPW